MDQIQKLLKKLTKKEREAFILVMLQLKKDFNKIPGLKKLTGYKNVYRIRIGKYRIIFKFKNTKTEIIRISKRSENTYKKLN